MKKINLQAVRLSAYLDGIPYEFYAVAPALFEEGDKLLNPIIEVSAPFEQEFDDKTHFALEELFGDITQWEECHE